MTRFIDEYLPECTNSYQALSGPSYASDLVIADSGAESANQRWSNPLWKFSIPQAVRDMDTMFQVRNHFMIMQGRAHTFPFQDPLDFASVDPENPGVEPTIDVGDQVIGTGNGSKTKFQLIKTYLYGTHSKTRNIHHPVVDSVVIALDGVPQASGWSISRLTGEITFDTAPGSDVTVSAGYLFDCEARYDHDDFDAIAVSYRAGGFADLELVEVPVC